LADGQSGADSSLLRVAVIAFLGGAGVSVSAPFLLAFWRPVAAIAGHSIRYSYGYGGKAGVTLVVSLSAALLIERDARTSVWCFLRQFCVG